MSGRAGVDLPHVDAPLGDASDAVASPMPTLRSGRGVDHGGVAAPGVKLYVACQPLTGGRVHAAQIASSRASDSNAVTVSPLCDPGKSYVYRRAQQSDYVTCGPCRAYLEKRLAEVTALLISGGSELWRR